MPKVSRDSAPQRQDAGPVVDLRDELDGYTVSFTSLLEDIDATPFMKGLPDDRCQCPHWGYQASLPCPGVGLEMSVVTRCPKDDKRPHGYEAEVVYRTPRPAISLLNCSLASRSRTATRESSRSVWGRGYAM